MRRGDKHGPRHFSPFLPLDKLGSLNSVEGLSPFSPLPVFRKPLFPFLLFLMSGLALLNASCTRQSPPYQQTMFMMGTLVDVTAYPEGKAAADAAAKAFARMGEIEAMAQRREVGLPLSPGRELASILETGLEVSRISGGAFDPTLGELTALWGFQSGTPRLPGAAEIGAVLSRVGYRRLEGPIPEGESLPVWIDLGGVAKGYAVDEAVRVLSGSPLTGGIVNAGGDLRVFGTKKGKEPWKIGVQDPDDPRRLAGVLTIREGAVATSGDYQRYFEAAGVRYHHILDPATGYPARSGLRGTTVIAPDCALADALATAAFVMGPEKGLRLLEEWEGVEGVLIAEGGEILTTSGIGTRISFEMR